MLHIQKVSSFCPWGELKSKKKERDALNSQINKEVAVIKKLKDEYEALKSKLGVKEDPAMLADEPIFL